MRRSRPSLIIFVASVICAILAVLPLVGINVLALPIPSFGLMTLAWALMAAGVVFARL